MSDSGCAITTRRDARIARLWTLIAASLMSASVVLTWFTENWVYRGITLLAPLLMLATLHLSGCILWRSQTEIIYYGSPTGDAQQSPEAENSSPSQGKNGDAYRVLYKPMSEEESE